MSTVQVSDQGNVLHPPKKDWHEFAASHPDAEHLRKSSVEIDSAPKPKMSSNNNKLIEKAILGVVTIACAIAIASFVVIGQTKDLVKTGDSTVASGAGSSTSAASYGWTWEGKTGPKYWGTLGGDADCLGTYEQSPIDIPAKLAGYPQTTTTTTNQQVKGLTTAGSSTTGNKFTVSQSHGAPKFSCKAAGTCGHITHNSKQYNLLQIHFHSPSEHTIDGKHYPLCAHLVHLAADGSVSVLGVMFDQTAASTSTSAPVQLVNKLFNHMSDTNTEMSDAVNVYDFVSANSGYYNYPGSFTTPPCTEGVNWIVQSEIIPVTKAQVDFFWNSIGGYPGNSRPTMPLNSRTIAYNVPSGGSPGAWAWNPYDQFGLPVGPDSWSSIGYPDCAGTKQSPIDFPVTADSKTATGKTAVATEVLISASPVVTDMITAAPAKFQISQSHGAPKYSCKNAGTCGTLTVPAALSHTGDTSFSLLQVHFHAGSEHTIDGKIFPLCAHMVHVNAAGTAYAVVGILFDTTEADSASTPTTTFIDTIFGDGGSNAGYLASTNDEESTQNLDFQTALVSPTSGFYNYEGSFTTPPCTEVVTWVVQAEIQKIKPSQAKLFYDHIGGFPGNFRPPQPIGGRSITYKVA